VIGASAIARASHPRSVFEAMVGSWWRRLQWSPVHPIGGRAIPRSTHLLKPHCGFWSLPRPDALRPRDRRLRGPLWPGVGVWLGM